MQQMLPVDHVTLPVETYLKAAHRRLRHLSEGTVATYIPPLAEADPAWFGIAIATVDGHCYAVGDSDQKFTIQSVSKPFVYGMALEDRGVDEVTRRIGVEPTGNPFNSISVDEQTRRAFNPMVNAGAIATTGMINRDVGGDRLSRLLAGFAQLAGRELQIVSLVPSPERATGDRNRAIAYFMRTFDIVPSDVEEVLDTYFAQCSLLVDCRDLAMIGATLANEGVHPITHEQALPAGVVPQVLSVMATCGMYDFSGEWVYRVGLPAKSGVGGGILAVLPGQLALAVFSPPLDDRGNSVRGIAVCEDFARHYELHTFGSHASAPAAVRQTYTASSIRSKRVRPPHHVDVLEADGGAVVVFEIQGNLYFGSMENVTRSVADVAAEGVYVLMDLARVTSIDTAATKLLSGLSSMLAERGTKLLLSAIPDTLTADAALMNALAICSTSLRRSTDSVLESCEDELLRRRGLAAELDARTLRDFDVLDGLGNIELEAIKKIAIVQTFQRGQTVFHAGDSDDTMHLIRTGTVSVFIAVDGKPHRLATMGPGTTFGEMALIDNERRSATIVADEQLECLVVSKTDLDALGAAFPNVKTRLYLNLARSLSRRLREAHREIAALVR